MDQPQFKGSTPGQTLTVLDAEQWEPCSPSWLALGGCCATAPRACPAASSNHWHPKAVEGVRGAATPTASSPEAVQWRNINKVVRALADLCFGNNHDPHCGVAHRAIVNSLTAKDGLDVLALGLEPLPRPIAATTTDPSVKGDVV